MANGNRFTRVEAGLEALGVMRDLASPVAAFVREKCATGPDNEVAIDDLYSAFKHWAEDNGHSKKSKSTFGRDLRAAVTSVSVKRPRGDDDRYRAISVSPCAPPTGRRRAMMSSYVQLSLRFCLDHLDHLDHSGGFGPRGPGGPGKFAMCSAHRLRAPTLQRPTTTTHPRAELGSGNGRERRARIGVARR